MSRAAANAMKNQVYATNALGSGYNTNAGQLYSSLVPQLTQMAQNPQGYAPTDISSMRTGARQAVGGSLAGVTGGENQRVARTRNSAGYNAVLDQASRQAGQQNSQDELAIEAANANLKQQQQQYALGSLGNLYGANVRAGESYYGMAPQELSEWNAASNAILPEFLGNAENIIGSIGKIGAGGYGAVG